MTHFSRGCCAVSCLILLLVSGQSWAQDGLFVAAPTPRVPAELERHVVRQREVFVNPSVLPPGDNTAPATLRLNLFDDVTIDIYLDRLESRGPKDYTWLGGIVGENEPDGAILVVKDDVVLIRVRSIRHGLYELRLQPNGQPQVREIDDTQLPSCGTHGEHLIQSPQASPDPRAPRDSSAVLDILVAYTIGARQAAGGVSGIEALINIGVAVANESYTFSNVPTRMRLVHTFETPYVESGNSGTDLSRFRSPTDGLMDGVHTRRNTYGADVCALITTATDVCGIGFLMANLSPTFEQHAFSITVISCLTGITLAHEVGHNMGSQHAVGDAGLTRGGAVLHTYSYGWRWTGLSGIQWRDVMAYDPGSQVSRFSNPDVLYDGVPTGVPIGDPNEANNAASLTSALSTATNWRATVNPMNVNPSTPFLSEGSTGGSFSPANETFRVSNVGNSTFNWTASKTQTWLTLSSSGGTLTSGNSANVVASFNGSASLLPPGTYTDTITFTDTTFGQTVTRNVTLDVLPPTVQSFSFDTNPGWTTQGQWAFGAPQGVGWDPASGRTGPNVYGYNLAGVYPNDMPEHSLTTTAINCAGYTNVALRFWRWLGVEDSIFDHARVDVSSNGSTWTTIWSNPGDSMQDQEWVLQTFDISAIANNQPTVFIRWVMGTTDESLRYSGWNIDDVSILGNLSGPPTNLAEAWVDFAYNGAELGTSGNPFNSVADGVAALKSDGTGVLRIKGNTADAMSAETISISKPMTIQAMNGTVRIGAP